MISTGLLKIIPNRHAENAKKLRKPPFPDFQGHFRGYKAGRALEHRERSFGVFEPSPAEAPAVVAQPIEPTLPLGRIAPASTIPNSVCRMGSMPAKPRVLRSSPRCQCARKRRISSQRRHRHRDDKLRRPSGKQPLRKTVSTILGNLDDGSGVGKNC